VTRPHDDALRTGTAFWIARSGLVATYPPLAGDETCDVAVIGAGVTGALAALRLAEAGASVVVVDEHDAGAGSTAASTGLLMYETDVELAPLVAAVGVERAVTSWRIGRDAIGDIERLCRPHPKRPWCAFYRRPGVYLATSKRDAARLRDESALRQRHGFKCEWLEWREVRHRLGLEGYGAIWSEDDAEVDPYRFTHRVLGMAIDAGARVYDRTGVTAVRTSSRGVRLTTSRGYTVRAARLVVATGYLADTDIAPRKGQLQSTWAMVTEPLGDLSWWRQGALVWEARRPYTYLRTSDDGRILVGGADEPFATSHRDRRVLQRKAERLMARLSELFPSVRTEVAFAWAGTFATSPDGLPYVGTHPKHPLTWFALGYGGNGITFSMVAANLAVEWWRGAPVPQVFAFDR
jgi:glycine/D-amino acid oxidase-like deaminating enzyme